MAAAAATDGFSGAELAAVVGEALRRAAHRRRETRGEPEVSVGLFHEVLAVYRPPQGVRESYRRMEELAAREVSFLDLLPERYRKGSG